MITYERITIKIAPALFEKLTYSPLTQLVRKPAKGRDEVICERDGKEVFMTIWWSDNGYDAIIWNELE